MDPASISGLIGTCVSLVAGTTGAIKTLHGLKSQFSDVDDNIAHLLSLVATIQSSVEILQQWLGSEPPTLLLNPNLRSTMEQSLNGCLIIISALEKHVSCIGYSANSLMSTTGKIRHIFNEDDVARSQRQLGSQVQALILLLNAIQTTSVVKQQQLMARSDSRMVTRRARDDASSYADLSHDHVSLVQRKVESEGHDPNTAFDFDDITINSHVYRSASQSFMQKPQESRSKGQAPGYHFEPNPAAD